MGLAQDPRLLEGEAARGEIEIERAAEEAHAGVTARWLPWSREGDETLDWVGVDIDGRPVLGRDSRITRPRRRPRAGRELAPAGPRARHLDSRRDGRTAPVHHRAADRSAGARDPGGARRSRRRELGAERCTSASSTSATSTRSAATARDRERPEASARSGGATTSARERGDAERAPRRGERGGRRRRRRRRGRGGSRDFEGSSRPAEADEGEPREFAEFELEGPRRRAERPRPRTSRAGARVRRADEAFAEADATTSASPGSRARRATSPAASRASERGDDANPEGPSGRRRGRRGRRRRGRRGSERDRDRPQLASTRAGRRFATAEGAIEAADDAGFEPEPAGRSARWTGVGARAGRGRPGRARDRGDPGRRRGGARAQPRGRAGRAAAARAPPARRDPGAQRARVDPRGARARARPTHDRVVPGRAAGSADGLLQGPRDRHRRQRRRARGRLHGAAAPERGARHRRAVPRPAAVVRSSRLGDRGRRAPARGARPRLDPDRRERGQPARRGHPGDRAAQPLHRQAGRPVGAAPLRGRHAEVGLPGDVA